MADQVPTYNGYMSRDELYWRRNPVWTVKDEDDEFDRTMLWSRFGGHPYHQFHDMEVVIHALHELKYSLLRMKLRMEEAEEKMNHTSCSNFLARMLPEDFQQRSYYVYPWMEAIIPVVDNAIFDGNRYEVMVAFPNDDSVKMAVLDSVGTTDKEGKVFITELRVKGSKNAFGDQAIDMGPNHRLFASIIRDAERIINETRKDSNFCGMDLVLHVCERQEDLMTGLAVANQQLLEGIEALLIGMKFLKDGGSLIIQTFNMERPTWLPVLYIMSCTFNTVVIRKTLAAVRHSGEVFIEASGFRKVDSFPIFSKLVEYYGEGHAEKDVLKGKPIMQIEALPGDFLFKAKDAIKTHVIWRSLFLRRGLGILAVKDQWDSIFEDLAQWKVLMAHHWFRKWKVSERLGLPICEGIPFLMKREDLIEKGIVTEIKNFYKIKDSWKRADQDLAADTEKDKDSAHPGKTQAVAVPTQIQGEKSQPGAEPSDETLEEWAHQNDLFEYLFNRVVLGERKDPHPLLGAAHKKITGQCSSKVMAQPFSYTVGRRNESIDSILAREPSSSMKLNGSMTEASETLVWLIRQLVEFVKVGASLYLEGADYDDYTMTALVLLLGHVFQNVRMECEMSGVLFWNREVEYGDPLYQQMDDGLERWENMLGIVNGRFRRSRVDPFLYMERGTFCKIFYPGGDADGSDEEDKEDDQAWPVFH